MLIRFFGPCIPLSIPLSHLATTHHSMFVVPFSLSPSLSCLYSVIHFLHTFVLFVSISPFLFLLPSSRSLLPTGDHAARHTANSLSALRPISLLFQGHRSSVVAIALLSNPAHHFCNPFILPRSVCPHLTASTAMGHDSGREFGSIMSAGNGAASSRTREKWSRYRSGRETTGYKAQISREDKETGMRLCFWMDSEELPKSQAGALLP